MFKITIKVAAGCLKHRRYNPERDGLAYRSACNSCARAYEIYQETMRFRQFLMGGREDDLPPKAVPAQVDVNVRNEDGSEQVVRIPRSEIKLNLLVNVGSNVDKE